MPANSLGLYALVPLTEQHLDQNYEIAVRPLSSPLVTLPQLEEILAEKQRQEDLLSKTTEALMT